MNKAELVDTVANQAGLTKAQAAKAVEALTNSVRAALRSGEKVVLVGFGTFEPVTRAARSGRNPGNGEAIQIAAKRAVRFSAGKALKDALN